MKLSESIISILEKDIVDYAKFYYSGNTKISDEEFDSLVDLLRKYNPDSDILKQVGWGSGIDISGKKTNHKYQIIGSLNKIKDVDNIPDYGSSYIISAKLDGLSAVCYYENNKLIKAVTRGDGHTGVDITDKIVRILNYNVYLTSTNISSFTGAIRGELVISNDNWELMRENDTNLKNQRNTVAGIINRNEITDDIKYVDFVPYNIIGLESLDNFCNNQTMAYKFLQNNFDKVCPNQYFGFAYKQEHKFDYDFLLNLYNGYRKIYPCDGLVIGNEMILCDYDYSVKYEQIAFKFQAEIKETEVLGIKWNLTRTGKLIPIIRVKEVELSGALVNNVTGYNAKFIKDNKICTGAIIGINRSNEVIPCFKYLVSSPEINDIPNTCTICGEKLEWNGVDIVCNNPSCSSKDFEDFKCWINNIAKVDDIGETLKLKFMDELGINSIDSIYKNKELRFSDNCGKQKQLFNVVMDKLTVDPVNIVDALCALNIPRLGRSSAEKLSRDKESINVILNFNVNDNKQILKRVVGDATTDSICNNLDKLYNLNYIKDRIIIEDIINNSDKELINVAITGKLSMKRNEFVKILNNNGYKLGSVNKNCKFLITDNPNSGSSKNKLADELGIEKITEEEFTKKYLK